MKMTKKEKLAKIPIKKPLEELFQIMLQKIKTEAKNNIHNILYIQDNLITQINLDKAQKVMHYMSDSYNFKYSCFFKLNKNTYYSAENNKYLPLTEEHRKEFQKFCDLYAKDGFKFKVILKEYMYLFWCKDDEIIDKNNFWAINELLNNMQIKLTIQKYCELKNISLPTFFMLKKQKKIPYKINKKNKNHILLVNPYQIVEIKGNNNNIIM